MVAQMIVKVEIRPVWTKGGYRYDIWHEGALIVPRSKAPAGDAARWCAGVGKFGKLEVWRPDATSPALLAEIEHSRTRTVMENEKAGPRFIKWRPYEGE
jgi:hypothetical protein